MSTVDPSLSNRDLAPTTPAQRTWGIYNYIALWFSMSMEITTYQLASSLIAKNDNKIIIKQKQTPVEAIVKSDRTGFRRALRKI